MICQKCDTENELTHKYCRKCGVILPAFETDETLTTEFVGDGYAQLKRSASMFFGIGAALFALGFLASRFSSTYPVLVIYLVGVAFLFAGLIKNLKAMEVMKNRSVKAVYESQQQTPALDTNELLPPAEQQYISTVSPYQTNELVSVPPSVTENTTRQLEMDSEGETMTLPKK